MAGLNPVNSQQSKVLGLRGCADSEPMPPTLNHAPYIWGPEFAPHVAQSPKLLQ